MTPLIEQADALMKGITPGEWEAAEDHGEHWVQVSIGDDEAVIAITKAERKAADAEFIAAAPQLVRDLLAENERLKRQAISISTMLSDAGVNAMPIEEAVRRVLAELVRLRSSGGQREWQGIESAPTEGIFLVVDERGRQMVIAGKILEASKKAGTPHHLSGHHWTHWKLLGDPPSLRTEGQLGTRGDQEVDTRRDTMGDASDRNPHPPAE